MVWLFGRGNPAKKAAFRLYDTIGRQARAAVFFERLAVPDTIDGRFDLLLLHVFLALEALKREQRGAALAKELVNVTFAGFDDALRQLGVSDFGMSRRIRAMADAFYGRLESYSNALADPAKMRDAILRNVFRGDVAHEPAATLLAKYALAAFVALEPGALLQGDANFPPPPAE